MFCYQCEQTAKGGCTKVGVCGKKDTTASLQDLLLYLTKGLAQVAVAARKAGIEDAEANLFTAKAVFSTLTNVNFDDTRFVALIEECVAKRDALKARIPSVEFSGPAIFIPAADLAGLVEQGKEFGVENDPETNPDLKSLKQTLTYGLKGVCAYADHAAILGKEDNELYAKIQGLLAATLSTDLTLEQCVEAGLECGRINIRAMELLDDANTSTYGHPEPTEVKLGATAGKAILVSGHDLKDLATLLKQTEGKGINIYTHGEMLPCTAYPELKKYKHLAGHYGTAWQNQQKEFAEFPGAILMTTNCIQKPTNYMDSIFTTGLVGWPGAVHVSNDDFTPVIEKALAMEGFPEDTEKGTVMTGFARNAVMSVAGTVIDAVKAGNIKHFFLVGGCDGAKPGRNYYTEFVEKTPADTVVLTLACGKFRFFDKQLGDIGGIPRLLDIGQCNDAYSAVQIALALADAFDCEVNDLPLSLVLSWYEQKAVAILLSLLALGIKNIKLGPTLPAFITPNVLNFLVENYNIAPISTPDEDLKEILG
ncbi:hydroxylamine reductase [Pseudodesulfovibrio piezophilus]|uniref:Hydroxylamine reductase n=1 Tax=Pseudodesulfovibrio piezophilus (strain DSM 21447 / JCM 15486 / C1TLV30) TaxID=1322246 RepID=M1WX68_PSEP2|nr:hydroxylamine reductase [Pseudodesulfovibrio piezophilus]CCH49548.1 Hydroxylamine reductase [Pseudodesulfovibrio piezophilus C1TLV30]